MKKYSWQISLGIILIIISAIVYLIHYAIFRDPHHIFIYLTGDIAFVFIEVLMVTLVIHSLLNMREKRERLEKLNMLIGVFFSEVGTRLLVLFSDSDPNLDKIKQNLIITSDWSNKEFEQMNNQLRNYEYKVNIDMINLKDLRDFFMRKSDFLVRLLENPNLFEHESFTEVLRAVFHIVEELEHRKNIKQLSKNDRNHIAGDIKRAYNLLVFEWLSYMKYLKDSYPYLFSLAIRLNPFDENATAEIK
jgi:hypothetical protein